MSKIIETNYFAAPLTECSFRYYRRAAKEAITERFDGLPVKLLGLGFTSRVRRMACIACTPFVIALIAFNILDLDGSNLASLTRSFDRFVIDAEVGGATCIDPSPEQFENFENNHRLLPLEDSPDRVRYQTIELRALSRLEKARTHLYHISLPRDCVPG